MVFELTLGNVITVLALVVAALWALAKMVNVQYERRIADKFDAVVKLLDGISTAQDGNAKAMQELERQFMRLQGELPLNYVRREDYVRGQSIVEAKLDGLATKLDNVQLRAAFSDRSHP